jgi:hypothetical protein
MLIHTVLSGRPEPCSLRRAAGLGLAAVVGLLAAAATFLVPAAAQAATTAPHHQQRAAATSGLASSPFQVGPYCPGYAWGSTVLAGSSWAPGVSNANVYSNNFSGSCANGDWGGTNAYGLMYQCTELAVRWADDYWGIAPSEWSSDVDSIAAKQMWPLAQSISGLHTIANGTAPPQFGDLLVLSDSGPGHVAVIVGVNDGYLYFVGENQDYTEDRIPITNGDDLTASAVTNWLGQSGTALGWISGPATAASGYDVAFQANTTDLWTTGTPGSEDWELAMMTGTSPAVTALSGGGYEVAFQASNGNLTLAGSAGITHLGLGLMAGTSPAIAGLADGSYEVAFQANTGDLYTYSPAGGATHLGLGLMAGTSPAIAGLADGSYEVAFQANTGDLYTYSPAGGATHLGLGLMAGTSPAITGLADGSYEVAFQANTGDLYTYSPASGATNLQLGMLAGTSPAIAGAFLE